MRDKRKYLMTKQRFLCLFIILTTTLLSACVEHDMTDLKKYVAKIKAQKNPPIEPIPEYKHIPNYYYGVHKLRDPFIAFMQRGVGGKRNLFPNETTGTQRTKRNCPKNRTLTEYESVWN